MSRQRCSLTFDFVTIDEKQQAKREALEPSRATLTRQHPDSSSAVARSSLGTSASES